MHSKARKLVSPMLGLALLVGPATAIAQDEMAAEEAPPPPPPPPPADEPAAMEPAAEPMATEAPPAEAPAAEAPAEEGDGISGWFRVDVDGYLGTQLWAGATHPLSDSIGLASDIYIDLDTIGELDLGPSITLSDSVSILPMVGMAFDFGPAARQAVSIVPQFFVYLTAGDVYWESWTQAFLNSVFVDGATNALYLRNFVTYSLGDVAIGPEVDVNLLLNPGGADTLDSLLPGGLVTVNYGSGNSILLFLGYETQDQEQGPDGQALNGRFTYVKTW